MSKLLEHLEQMHDKASSQDMDVLRRAIAELKDWRKMLDDCCLCKACAATFEKLSGEPHRREEIERLEEQLRTFEEIVSKRDEAVRALGVMAEELVLAGGKAGDRVVALANLRVLISERDELKARVRWREGSFWWRVFTGRWFATPRRWLPVFLRCACFSHGKRLYYDGEFCERCGSPLLEAR